MSDTYPEYFAGEYVMLTDEGIQTAGAGIQNAKDALDITRPIKIVSVSENMGNLPDFFQDIAFTDDPLTNPCWMGLCYSSWDVRRLTSSEKDKFKL